MKLCIVHLTLNRSDITYFCRSVVLLRFPVMLAPHMRAAGKSAKLQSDVFSAFELHFTFAKTILLTTNSGTATTALI